MEALRHCDDNKQRTNARSDCSHDGQDITSYHIPKGLIIFHKLYICISYLIVGPPHNLPQSKIKDLFGKFSRGT